MDLSGDLLAFHGVSMVLFSDFYGFMKWWVNGVLMLCQCCFTWWILIE